MLSLNRETYNSGPANEEATAKQMMYVVCFIALYVAQKISQRNSANVHHMVCVVSIIALYVDQKTCLTKSVTYLHQTRHSPTKTIIPG